MQRAAATLPKQGAKKPWRLYQNYLLDLLMLRFGRIDDGTLSFARAADPSPLPVGAAQAASVGVGRAG